MSNIELRCLASSELRTAGDRRLVGYAAVFGQLSEPIMGFREKIRQGAFARAISSHQDVRALLNHDPSQVLGRTRAGTLELSEDQHGLRSIIHLPDTTLGHDLWTSIHRGDITQMSFGFRANQDAWSNDRTIRELIDVDLFDVSPVTYPAYPQTSVGTRGMSLGWYSGGVTVPTTEPSEDDRDKLRLMLRLAQMIK